MTLRELRRAVRLMPTPGNLAYLRAMESLSEWANARLRTQKKWKAKL